MTKPTPLAELAQMVESGRLRRAVEARSKAQDRQNVQSELQHFAPFCDGFVAAAAIARHVVPVMDAGERARLRVHLHRIRELAENVRYVAMNDAELRTFGRLLTDARHDPENASHILKQAFVKFVSTTFNTLANLGELVSGIASLEQVGREFSEIAKESGRLLAKFPPTPGTLNWLDNLTSRRQKAMTLLSSSNAGATLASFLSKVADGNATLADVTPNVSAFLESQRASQLFRIRFGA